MRKPVIKARSRVPAPAAVSDAEMQRLVMAELRSRYGPFEKEVKVLTSLEQKPLTSANIRDLDTMKRDLAARGVQFNHSVEKPAAGGLRLNTSWTSTNNRGRPLTSWHVVTLRPNNDVVVMRKTGNSKAVYTRTRNPDRLMAGLEFQIAHSNLMQRLNRLATRKAP